MQWCPKHIATAPIYILFYPLGLDLRIVLPSGPAFLGVIEHDYGTANSSFVASQMDSSWAKPVAVLHTIAMSPVLRP